LITLGLITILQFAFVALDVKGIVRIGTGFLYVAFIPGYLLLTFLLDGSQVIYISLRRLILSIPISLALSLVVGYLGYLISPRNVNELTQAFLIGISSIILIGLAFARQRRPRMRGGGAFYMFLLVLLIAVLTPALVASPGRDKQALSLYVLGPTGTLDDLPMIIDSGESIRVILGGEYVGDQPQSLTIVSSLGSQYSVDVNPPADTWSLDVEESFSQAGTFRLSWQLYRPGDVEPAGTVSIWVVVK
jgi:uncharacterized membrane protein